MRRLLPVLIVAVLALLGCAPSQTDSSRSSRFAAARLIVAIKLAGAGDNVASEAVLGIDSSGCITFGDKVVLVTPPGSTLHNGTVLIPANRAHPELRLKLGAMTPALPSGSFDASSDYIPKGANCNVNRYRLVD